MVVESAHVFSLLGVVPGIAKIDVTFSSVAVEQLIDGSDSIESECVLVFLRKSCLDCLY